MTLQELTEPAPWQVLGAVFAAEPVITLSGRGEIEIAGGKRIPSDPGSHAGQGVLAVQTVV